MTKILSFTIALYFCVVSVLNAQNKKDTIPGFIGVSYIPKVTWRVIPMENIFPKFMRDKTYERPKYLKYNFDLSEQSSFEGNFGIRRIGLRFGISANIENNLVGKAYKYGGYIGFKDYWLKLQTSNISGNAYWARQEDVGYISPFDFSSKFINIELIKNSNMYKHMSGGASTNILLGTHWGIGYTSFGIPIQIETLTTPGGREHQVYGRPAFDKLLNAKYYTFLFGWDMIRQLCLTSGRYGAIPGQPAKHFGIYAATHDKFGFGSGHLSQSGVLMAEALNPGKTIVKDKGFSFMASFYLSTGFRYYCILRPVFMVAAVGYDFEGFLLNGGPPADTDKDLGYEYDPFVINRGVSFKLYISWIGNK